MRSLILLFVVLSLFSSSYLCEERGGVCGEDGICGETHGRKKVAIVGGGVGGSSAAYYISKLLPNVDITIYEKDEGVCGRVQDTIINGKNVEVGGSIYHESNANVDGFVKLFNLTKHSPFGDSSMGIWDGKEFVFRGSDVPVVGKVVNLAKMFYRYGWAPYNLKTYLESLMGNWSTLYTRTEPFHSIDEFFDAMGLKDEISSNAVEHLEKHGISRQFTREILGAMTRVNYNTDVEIMNAFGVAVSAIGSGDSVYGVKEGNKHICTNLVSSAKANAKYGHKVTSIVRQGTAQEPQYVVSTSEEELTYDAVVIAVPLELANIKFVDVGEDPFVFHARDYQEVYVTFVAGELNSEYFHVLNNSAPHVVLTIENPSVPFSSIGRSKNITLDNGLPVSKVFSRTPFTQETIDKVFVNGSVVFKKAIHAYPILRVPTKLVPIKLAPAMYYVNAMETVVSTIETETISAKNIARLLAVHWALPHHASL